MHPTPLTTHHRATRALPAPHTHLPRSFLRDLTECIHYAIKLAERAAAAGAVSLAKPGRRRKAAGGGGDDVNGGGGSDDDEDGDLGKLKGKKKKGKGGDGYTDEDLRLEKAFELERYVADLCHPAVIQAYVSALGTYTRNGPKVRR